MYNSLYQINTDLRLIKDYFLNFYLKNIIYMFLFSYQRDIYTVGENIIATTKIRNYYGAIQSFIFSNFGLFSLAPCEFITLNPLSILFGIHSLLFLWLSF